MEVHHHSHTERKKWHHYLWEFLMLFLAVFCGFLAEYQLEHKIEKDRASELAKSFYAELKNDSIEVQEKVSNRLKKDSAISYLANYFEDSSLNEDLPKAFGINFTLAFMTQSPIIFEPRIAVLDQLKNSGSLRYFKSNELQKLTGDISVAIANLKSRQEVEQGFMTNFFNLFSMRHGDYKWLKKIRGKGDTTLLKNLENYAKSSFEFPFHLGAPEQINKTETMNMLQVFLLLIQSTRINHYKKYIDLNHELLDELRKQYHLK